MNMCKDFCFDNCPIGREAKQKFLDENNSAYDAAIDFRLFVEECKKSCKIKLGVDLAK